MDLGQPRYVDEGGFYMTALLRFSVKRYFVVELQNVEQI
jgi:hypothetical protein